MPPKREKDKDGDTIKQTVDLMDHELFLQSFDKPTQIYRYLRTRHVVSPIFIYRTLWYMRNRMSRSHKSRKDFKVDSILLKKTSGLNKAFTLLGNHLQIQFQGFYHKNNDEKFVKVDTILIKMSHNKRKESTNSITQSAIATTEVLVNPTDSECEKAECVRIPAETFKSMGEPSHLSIFLIFHIQNLNIYNYNNKKIINDVEEPSSKRLKYDTVYYETELLVFDKHGRCILTDNVYELPVQALPSSSLNIKPNSILKKNLAWESIDDENITSVDLFTENPTIKFRLKWGTDSVWGLKENAKMNADIDRPLKTFNSKLNFSNMQNLNNNNVYNNNDNSKNEVMELKNNMKNMDNSINRNYDNNNDKILVVYRFVYNNSTRQQTITPSSYECPWCSLQCNCLYILLKHLNYTHPRFVFTYFPLNDVARIDVTINDLYDGSYSGSPHDLLRNIGFVSRNGPIRRTSVTNILVCRPRRHKESLNEFLELDENEFETQRSHITGHNRIYHHTKTCLPIHPRELDIDSEGELDPIWLKHKTMKLIDEFSDVNEGEKELMKLWNLHFMKNGYVGDCQIPIACEMFVEMKGKEILTKNLYRNFVLHICSLFNFGLLSPEHAFKIIQKLQVLMSENDECKKVVTDARKKQMEYWLKMNSTKEVKQEVNTIK